MAAIGQVTASLAHEIGNASERCSRTLTTIGSQSPGCAGHPTPLKIINAQLGIIVQTVKSLLERTHRRRIMFELIDVNSAVQELALLVDQCLNRRNINASITLAGDLPRVSADRDSLHQVFLNLVNNSCDAMPNGGELEIATRYLSQNQQVEIMFSDSGAGIALDVVEHLFEPMFTTKQSGSGWVS